MQDDQHQQLQLVSELAGNLARELSDPVSVVLGRLELLQAVENPEIGDVLRHVAVALGHARRIATTLTNMRLVGHAQPGQMSTCSVGEILDESMELLVHELKRVAISVKLEPSEIEIVGDAAYIVRVLADLIKLPLDKPVSRNFWFEGSYVGEEVCLRLLFGDREFEDEIHKVEHQRPGLLVALAIVMALGGRLVERTSERLHCFEIWLPR